MVVNPKSLLAVTSAMAGVWNVLKCAVTGANLRLSSVSIPTARFRHAGNEGFDKACIWAAKCKSSSRSERPSVGKGF